MKRGPMFVLAGAVAGFAGILSLHSKPTMPTALPGPHGDARSPGGSHAGHVKDGPTAGQAGQRSTGSASPSAIRGAVGETVQYGYGELAVKVTMRGNRITNITVPVLQTAEQYSQNLADQAIPSLRSEVLAAQTAQISAVSGATYTSEAYATSVQAALDKLRGA